jgi:hypothetical protein
MQKTNQQHMHFWFWWLRILGHVAVRSSPATYKNDTSIHALHIQTRGITLNTTSSLAEAAI